MGLRKGEVLQVAADLITHIQKRAHSQAESEALVVAHKVAHILQQEVAWPVQITETQVCHHLQGQHSSIQQASQVNDASRVSVSPSCGKMQFGLSILHGIF